MLRMRSVAAPTLRQVSEHMLLPVVPVVVCTLLSLWLLVASAQLWRCQRGGVDRVWKMSEVPSDLYEMITHMTYMSDAGIGIDAGASASKFLGSQKALKRLCPCKNYGDPECECDFAELLRRAARFALGPKFAKRRKRIVNKLGLADICPEDGKGLLPSKDGYQCVVMVVDYLVFARVALQHAAHAVKLVSVESPFVEAASNLERLMLSFPDGKMDVLAYHTGNPSPETLQLMKWRETRQIYYRNIHVHDLKNNTVDAELISAHVTRRSGFDFVQTVLDDRQMISLESLLHMYGTVAPGGFMAILFEKQLSKRKGLDSSSAPSVKETVSQFIREAAKRTEGYVLPIFVQSVLLPGKKTRTAIVLPHPKEGSDGSVDLAVAEMDDSEVGAGLNSAESHENVKEVNDDIDAAQDVDVERGRR